MDDAVVLERRIAQRTVGYEHVRMGASPMVESRRTPHLPDPSFCYEEAVRAAGGDEVHRVS